MERYLFNIAQVDEPDYSNNLTIPPPPLMRKVYFYTVMAIEMSSGHNKQGIN